jgi:hypothetical protein
MEFSNLLNPDAIRIFSSVSSKKRLLHDLAGIAETCYRTDYSSTVEALIETRATADCGVLTDAADGRSACSGKGRGTLGALAASAFPSAMNS